MSRNLEIWEEKFDIAPQLSSVQKTIKKEVSKVHGRVGQSLKDAFNANGKLVRPALVILFARFGSVATDDDKLINIAASVEILHNATLIHDDLIDESDLRRGQPSVQAKYGKKVAVYAGDYLFAICFRLLSDNSKSMDSLRVDGRTMQGILGGELEQLDNTYNPNLSKEAYLNQINGKTGLLFGLSAFLGSFESDLPQKKAKKAAEFGELLGQAFQIQDDILDYTKTAEDINKPVLLDVKNGIYSGPLIFALQNDHDNKLQDLIEKGKKLTNPELNEVRELVVKLGGVQKAQELAETQTDKALTILDKNFPDGPAKDDIKNLAEILLNRQY